MPPADGSAQTSSQRWLDGLLWSSAPSTVHLRKFRQRTRAAVPPILLDNFESIEQIKLAGLPAGAEVIGGEADGAGGWLLTPSSAKDFAVVPAPGSEAANVQLSVEISGRETAGDEAVTVLGGISVALPSTRIGPLFRDLPDMKKAKARREAADKAKHEAAAKEAAQPKAPAPPAAAAKAEPKPEVKQPASKPSAPKLTATAAKKPETKLTAADKPAPPAKPARTVAMKPAAKPVMKPAPKPTPKAKAELKAAATPPAKPARTVAMRPAAKPVTKSASKPTPKVKAEPKAAATPPAKPARTVAMKPVAKPEPKAKANPKAAATPPAKPARTVAMKPVAKPEPKAKAEPKAVATPPAKPARAVTMKPVEKPEDKPAVIKPAMAAPPKPTVAKPPARTAPPKPTVIRTPAPAKPAPAKASQLTGPIFIELGGAPEVGDPHFRIFIDDEQVLDGNIDWGLGLPAAGDDSDGICWQRREIPWDFAGGPPSEIVVSYDGGGPGESGAGTLMARTLQIGDVRIDADGPHAGRPEGEHDWVGRGEGRSWVGRLIFDVAAATGGSKSGGSTDKPATQAETRKPATETPPDEHFMRSGETLVLRPNAADLANPAVLASFAALRARLRGTAEEAGGEVPEMLGRLNFDAAKWSDLLVLDPDGRPVAIGDMPPPMLPEPLPKFSPSEVQAALERLQSTPELGVEIEAAPEDAVEIGQEIATDIVQQILPPSQPEPIAMPALSERFRPGSDLRDVFFAERMARAQATMHAALMRSADATEETRETAPDVDWRPVTAAEGLRLRESFLTAWEIRADTRIEEHAVAPQAARMQSDAPSHRSDRTGAGVSQAFLTQHLRNALERLHVPAEHKPKASHAANWRTMGNAVSRGGGPLGGAFLDELVERARARMAPEAGAAI
jgi:hypothetical protein